MVKQLANPSIDIMKEASEMFDLCNGDHGSDPCEAAMKIGMCLMENGAKRKMMFNF